MDHLQKQPHPTKYKSSHFNWKIGNCPRECQKARNRRMSLLVGHVPMARSRFRCPQQENKPLPHNWEVPSPPALSSHSPSPNATRSAQLEIRMSLSPTPSASRRYEGVEYQTRGTRAHSSEFQVLHRYTTLRDRDMNCATTNDQAGLSPTSPTW